MSGVGVDGISEEGGGKALVTCGVKIEEQEQVVALLARETMSKIRGLYWRLTTVQDLCNL